jgi:hypothetical protein
VVREKLASFVGFATLAVVACSCGREPPPVSAPVTSETAPGARDDRIRWTTTVAEASAPKNVSIQFENTLRLVGFRVDPPVVRAGDSVRISLDWCCIQPAPDGFQLFTHLEDVGKPAGNRGVGNLDYAGALRELADGGGPINGPDRWQAGGSYHEELPWTVPSALSSETDVEVFVGAWKGDARLRVVAGPNDGDNRGVAGRFHVGASSP